MWVYTLSSLVVCATISKSSAQSCKAVPLSQCGHDFTDNCLKCGSDSSFDCEECCPGCTLDTKGQYKYCTCSGPPSPKPSPSPSGGGEYLCKDGQCYEGFGTMTKAQCETQCKSPDPKSGNFTNYNVAGMDVIALTGNGTTEKIVVMLHGGGGSGQEWRTNYDDGWFGNTDGIKYVWPTSPNSLWYGSTKQAGCGFCDECAYTSGSIEESATRIATLIEHEKVYVGGQNKSIYLAGFSQGGQISAYMQIAKLDFALGGTIILDGYPLPPVCNAETVKSKATYTGADMNWFIYWGSEDPIFPPQESLSAFRNSFEALGLPNSTIAFEKVEQGMGHSLSEKEFNDMVNFIRENDTNAL